MGTAAIDWRVANVPGADFEAGAFDLWHDRAAFHFLTAPADVERYAARAAHAVKPGGLLVVSTFAHAGPEKCSGQFVRRYGESELAAAFSPAFAMLEARETTHLTPAGADQIFIETRFRRAAPHLEP